MSNMRWLFLCFALLLCSEGFTQRSKTNFGKDWEFKREEVGSEWQSVSIPHTTKVEPLIVNNQFQGVSYYRKTFVLNPSANSKYFLYFEGVMQEAEFSVNGKLAAVHKGGYLPCTVDATKFLSSGTNTLDIKVVNTDNPEVPPGKPLKDLDFNYYGGIYRNVYLITTSEVYITDALAADKIASGGVFVQFNQVGNDLASGSIQIHLQNDSQQGKSVSVKTVLTNKNGQSSEIHSPTYTVKSASDIEITQNLSVVNPLLWSVNNPNLYDVALSVMSDGKVVDSYHLKTGIRKSEIRNDGYYLNNEKIYIPGTNRHQEYPYLGYAISDEAQYRDAVKVKNAGFDFVRLSHYPQAEAFLNACDELGILVMNSIPGWQFFGNEQFQKNTIQTVRDMARRDRNHPSIIFWEVSLNESNMTDAFMIQANTVLRQELPNRDNYTAGWMDNLNYDLYIPARQHGKAPDYWTKYDAGNRKIFIAEYGDWEYYAQNAGFNQKEFSNLKEEERTSRQLRGFGEKRLLQQAFNFQEASNSNRKGRNTIGEANWLMFDYNRGYSNDLESSGISDIFRIPKFAYYFYQSQRDASLALGKNVASGAMVKIANYWTSTSPTKVTIYSNCEEVALYLNDTLIAKQKAKPTLNSDSLSHPPFIFDVGKYQSGTLRADGFIGGKKVVTDLVQTPIIPSQLKLEYDLSSQAINREFPDMVFVYAKITDAKGTVMPDASNSITFKLEGSDAELIGENPVKAEAGIATIILRTTTFKKPIQITATSATLQTAKMTIQP